MFANIIVIAFLRHYEALVCELFLRIAPFKVDYVWSFDDFLLVSGVVQSVLQVGLLVIHENVGIKTSDAIEQFAFHEHVGSRYEVDGSGCNRNLKRMYLAEDIPELLYC